MADNTEDDPDETEARLDDADLASLLAEHNETEEVERVADLIARFYLRVRNAVDPVMTSAGDVHDPALELTREWMTYTIGVDQ